MGAMPPDLASKFTEGERAVLAIVAIDVYRHGYCRRRSPEIAALAGMAAARPAIRAAEELGLLTARLNNRDSTIEIVSPKWAAWLTPYHGGVTSKARSCPPALGKAKAGAEAKAMNFDPKLFRKLHKLMSAPVKLFARRPHGGFATGKLRPRQSRSCSGASRLATSSPEE